MHIADDRRGGTANDHERQLTRPDPVDGVSALVEATPILPFATIRVATYIPAVNIRADNRIDKIHVGQVRFAVDPGPPLRNPRDCAP
ncbi:MAG: hypothetical protein H0T72_01130 [Chloroflexia bacterium]|nr:hypothetical protein [Chloroflexia bacterium]